MEGPAVDAAITHVEPWPPRQPAAPLAASDIFLCAYEFDMGADTNVEAAFLCRRNWRHELLTLLLTADEDGALVTHGPPPVGAPAGLAAAMPAEEDDHFAAALLLGGLFEARIRMQVLWPVSITVPALIGDEVFRHRLGRRRMDPGRVVRRKHARAHCDPGRRAPAWAASPTGWRRATIWRAACPSLDHELLIDAGNGRLRLRVVPAAPRSSGIAPLRAGAPRAEAVTFQDE